MAALVRVNSTACGIRRAKAFSCWRISLTALAASAASSWLPCEGMTTKSARLMA